MMSVLYIEGNSSYHSMLFSYFWRKFPGMLFKYLYIFKFDPWTTKVPFLNSYFWGTYNLSQLGGAHVFLSTKFANKMRLGTFVARNVFFNLLINFSIFFQIATGKGILAQFGYETGLSVRTVDYLVGFLVAFNLIAAILPTSQTF